LASGGPPQALCNVDSAYGGSWNREGVILFSSAAAQGSLQRVMATGGIPATVMKPEGGALEPAFFPDGRRFFYSGRRGLPEGIYVGSLDSNESRLLLEHASNAVFAPSAPGSFRGHLLYLREKTLMARPFDSASAQLAGDEFPVAEDVSLNPRGPYTPVVVSDNGVLMYWNSTVNNSNQIAWFDRAGKLLGSMSGNAVLSPSISPDEKMIVFGRATGTGSDLWFWDLTRRTDTRLTSEGSRNTVAFWSPKGDRVVFRSERGKVAGDLYGRAANGSGQDELLVKTANNKIPSQWSRDGKFIVYAENDPKTKWDIWVLPVKEDGKARGKPMPFLQTEFSESHGQRSPDGQWIDYTSDESGQREMYVQPFPVGNNKWKISTMGGVQPHWRGDGKELFFATPDGKIMAVSIKSSVAPKPLFEAGAPSPLFETHLDTTGIAIRYDVTSDGKRFFVETSAASSPARLTVWSNSLTGLKR